MSLKKTWSFSSIEFWLLFFWLQLSFTSWFWGDECDKFIVEIWDLRSRMMSNFSWSCFSKSIFHASFKPDSLAVCWSLARLDSCWSRSWTSFKASWYLPNSDSESWVYSSAIFLASLTSRFSRSLAVWPNSLRRFLIRLNSDLLWIVRSSFSPYRLDSWSLSSTSLKPL